MSTRTHHTAKAQAARGNAASRLPGKAADQALLLEDADDKALRLASAETPEAALTEAAPEAVEGTGAEAVAESSGIGALTGGGVAIGAGVLGVAAIAAISDSGSGSRASANGSHHGAGGGTSAPIGQNPHGNAAQPGGNTATPTPQPGADTDQGDGQAQTAPRFGQAEAKGTAEAALVSVDGETRLVQAPAAFGKLLADPRAPQGDAQFIRIDRIHASEGGGDHQQRLIRYPEEPQAQGALHSRIVLKDPAVPGKLTAYEVIRLDKGISLAEARAAAARAGGKLLEVEDAAEARWLQQQFIGQLGENTGPADLMANGAWIGAHHLMGNGGLSAAIRAQGSNPDSIHYFEATAGQTLKAYVIEYPDYRHPLTLNGQPVEEGSVIRAEDFGKLVWNASTNSGGQVHFSVVNDANAQAPGEVRGQMLISESADVLRPILPPAGAGSQQPGGQGTEPGDSGQQGQGQSQGQGQDQGNGHGGSSSAGSGSGAGTGSGQQQDQSGHHGHHGNGTNSQGSNDQGQNDPPEKPDPSKEPGENLPLPAYPSDNTQDATVPQDKADALLDRALFEGEGNHKATYIKILRIVLPEVSAGQTEPVLSFHTADGQVKPISHTDKNIVLASNWFHKIVWNASLGEQGEIEFIPVADEIGTHIRNASKQLIVIDETPASQPAQPEGPAQSDGSPQPTPPATTPQAPGNDAGGPKEPGDRPKEPGDTQPEHGQSGENQQGDDRQDDDQSGPSRPPANDVPQYENTGAITVAHDAPSTAIGREIFIGSNPKAPARYVEILKIEHKVGQAAPAGTLKKNGQPLTVGDKVADTEFDQITWDARHTDGGLFTFKPVADLQGTPIPGAPELQAVFVTEAPANLPTYPDTNQTVSVAHDGRTSFTPSLFEGNHPDHKATHVRVYGIKDGTPERPDAELGTLSFKGEPVNASGKVIPVAEASQLVWDASKAEQGSFLFRPVSPEGRNLPGSTAQTVVIDEHKQAPTYGPDASPVELPEDQTTKLDASLFTGSNLDNKPAFIKITAIDTAGALLKGTAPIQLNELINADEFSQIHWNAALGDNGSFSFVPVLNGEGAEHLGAQSQTVEIREVAGTSTDAGQGKADQGNTGQGDAASRGDAGSQGDTGSDGHAGSRENTGGDGHAGSNGGEQAGAPDAPVTAAAALDPLGTLLPLPELLHSSF